MLAHDKPSESPSLLHFEIARTRDIVRQVLGSCPGACEDKLDHNGHGVSRGCVELQEDLHIIFTRNVGFSLRARVHDESQAP